MFYVLWLQFMFSTSETQKISREKFLKNILESYEQWNSIQKTYFINSTCTWENNCWHPMKLQTLWPSVKTLESLYREEKRHCRNSKKISEQDQKTGIQREGRRTKSRLHNCSTLTIEPPALCLWPGCRRNGNVWDVIMVGKQTGGSLCCPASFSSLYISTEIIQTRFRVFFF